MDLFIARAEVARIIGRPDARDLAGLVAEFKRIRGSDVPGLVWRQPVEQADPVFLRYGDRLVVDLSVWRSYADVWQSAYASRSLNASSRRGAWLTSSVLWWVTPRDTPGLDEAVQRLEHLERYGPGSAAFTLRSPAPPPREPVPTANVTGPREARELCVR